MRKRHYPAVIRALQKKHLQQGTLWVMTSTLLVQVIYLVNLWENRPEPLAVIRFLTLCQLGTTLAMVALVGLCLRSRSGLGQGWGLVVALLTGLSWSLASVNMVEGWGEYQASKQVFMLGCLTVVIGWYSSKRMMLLACGVILSAFAYLTLKSAESVSYTYYLSVLKFPVIIVLASVFLRRWHYFGLDRYSQNLQLLEQFKRETTLDPLTQVQNRRGFDKALADGVASARRFGMPLSLMLIDIDHFKQYNDALGHDQGDKGLKLVAETLSNLVARHTDMFCRVGGEEFAVLLPGTDIEGAKVMAQRMQQAMEQLNLAHPDSVTSERVTLSMGMAQYHLQDSDAVLYRKADQALYHAKSQGRDCWAVAQEPVAQAINH